MTSMKASLEGRVLIKQAIAQKGWRVRDDRWLVAASYILEPEGDWQTDGPYAYGCSLQTWERFLQGVAIRDRSFIAFCKILGLLPAQVAESIFPQRLASSDISEAALQSDTIAHLSFEGLLSRIVLLEHRMSGVEYNIQKMHQHSLISTHSSALSKTTE